jgi:oligopeptide transport system permease protein
MLRFILNRFVQSIVVVFIVFTITFFLIRLAPGDPFAGEKAMPPDVRKVMEARYGLQDSTELKDANGETLKGFAYFQKRFPGIVKEYWPTLKSYARGDFMPSFKYQGMWNKKLIADSFPISLTIGLAALGIALGVGLPAGIIAAVRRNSWVDYGAMSLAMIGICLPAFVMGPILASIFGLNLRWFNVAGWFERTDWILPSATMGLIYAAYIERMTRGGMLEVLNQDFIRTAHAKGASPQRIVLVHALRGGLIPVVAFLGPALAGITTGSFIIEKIFNLPGLGQHFVQSVMDRDYSLILATVVLFAVLLVTVNFFTDILIAWLNPRVRLT